MDVNLALRAVERLIIALTGALCIYLGYLLFVKGVSGKASLRVEHDKSKLQLANAMPGIFFALFGAAILVFMAKQSVGYSAALIPGTADEAGSSTPQSTTEARALLDLFNTKGIGTPGLYITGQEGTRKDILKKLEEASRRGDVVIFYFAGHGSAKPETPAEARHEAGKESGRGQPRH